MAFTPSRDPTALQEAADAFVAAVARLSGVAVRALHRGRVDAAATFDRAPQIHLKEPALVAQLVAVGETPEIPEAGICARPGLPAAAIQAVKRALLSMKRPEHAAVLKQIYDIDGFVEARNADYDPVRDALELMDYRPGK
ncbi:MAG: PhnD/SsuA/transferrin family substrate-binding protein [Candidatus Rokubacteria bacterium]|nr:PhnD/SsuA/transferrin family substrate-binding protein [Candidatus Rokubacteria bacterium]